MACRWFDSGRAGYIRDEDLEEIAYMVCNSISREPTILLAALLLLYTFLKAAPLLGEAASCWSSQSSQGLGFRERGPGFGSWDSQTWKI